MMKRQVTLNVSDNILSVAAEIASRSHRQMEDVLEEWLDRYAYDLPLETLSDEEVLRQSRFEMNLIQKQELRNLLYAHRVRQLAVEESTRLDTLLKIYRKGTVRRARALDIALARGLINKSE